MDSRLFDDLQPDVLIVGGGLIGLFSAWYLNKAGLKVAVVDSGPIPGPQSCSFGNAGMIVPSHFVPFATRHAFTQAIKSPFMKHSAIGIQPGKDLIPWMFQFSKAAFFDDLNQKKKFLATASLESRDLYKQLHQEESIDFQLNLSGIQMLCRSAKTLKHEVQTGLIASDYGIKAEIWSAEEFLQNNPGMKARIAGAVYYPFDGAIDPFPMQKVLTEKLQQSGVRFLQNTPVLGWKHENGRIMAATTQHGVIGAGQFLIAAGGQTDQLTGMLRLSLPVLPGKGSSYQTKSPEIMLRIPTLLQDEHVAITPYPTHVRVASRFILGNRSSRVTFNDLQQVDSSIRKSLPNWSLSIPKTDHAWAGFRPVSPDGLPLIGRSQKFDNLAVAGGHAMIGLSLAPYTGLLVSKLLSDKQVHDQTVKLLNPGRFGQTF